MPSRRAKQRISLLGAVAALIALGAGGYGVGRWNPGGGGGGGGPNLANAWVNTTAGGSPQGCLSPAQGCAYNSSNAFGSAIAAYNWLKTNQGCGAATIYFRSGTYAQQDMNMALTGNLSCGAIGCHFSPLYPQTGTGTWPDGSTQTQNLSGCKTISPEPGQESNVHVVGFQMEAPYEYVKNFQLTYAQDCYNANAVTCQGGLSMGGSSTVVRTSGFNCTSIATGELIADNLSGMATAAIQGNNFNVALVNSVVGPAWESRANKGVSSPIASCVDLNCCAAQGSSAGQNERMLIYNTTWKDYSVIAPASHNECIHFYSSYNWIFKNVQFDNCSGNSIATQDQIATNGGAESPFQPVLQYGLISQVTNTDPCGDLSPPGIPTSIGSPYCSAIEGGYLTFRCANGTPDNQQNITIEYTSQVGIIQTAVRASPAVPGDDCTDAWPANSGFKIIGNIATSFGYTAAAAALKATGFTGSGYNLWTGQTPQFSNDVQDSSHTIIQQFVDPNARTWNFRLPTGFTSSAKNLVPCGFPPAFAQPSPDLYGTPRPQGANCDAGVAEQ